MTARPDRCTICGTARREIQHSDLLAGWCCDHCAPNRVDRGENSSQPKHSPSRARAHAREAMALQTSTPLLNADVDVDFQPSLSPFTPGDEKQASEAGEIPPTLDEIEELLALHAAGGTVGLVLPLMRPLPAGSPEPLVRVASYFRLVWGLERWAGVQTPTVFPCDWVAGKVGLPSRTTSRLIAQLRAEFGVMEKVGAMRSLPVNPAERGGPRKRGAYLYVLSPLPGADVAAGAASDETPLPDAADSVEADGTAAVDQRQEVGEDVPVRQAVAANGREAGEVDDGLPAPAGFAGGGNRVGAVIGHGVEITASGGGKPTNRGPGMTREAAQLDHPPRPERLRHLWAAMSPKAQERAWEALDDDARVDLIAASFDATELAS